MSSRLRDFRFSRSAWASLLVVAVIAVAGVAGLALRSDDAEVAGRIPRAVTPSISASATASASASAVPAAPAPDRRLPAFSYFKAPRGFPADPAPASKAAVTEGLRLTADRVVYDKPGGTPKAVLPSSISGLPVTVPIVERRTGWVAVLLPSANRRVGWLTVAGWEPVALRDQLVLRRRTHELTWIRDGARQASWTVATGAPATETPLGRTFVLGRVATDGEVYAGLDALALDSVPDHPDSLPSSLRAGHTAIHGWYRASAFGRSISNGCIRVPKKGQRTMLNSIAIGTVVHVVD